MGKVRPGIIMYQVASARRGWGWKSAWGAGTQSRSTGGSVNVEDVFIGLSHVGTCDLIKS